MSGYNWLPRYDHRQVVDKSDGQELVDTVRELYDSGHVDIRLQKPDRNRPVWSVESVRFERVEM